MSGLKYLFLYSFQFGSYNYSIIGGLYDVLLLDLFGIMHLVGSGFKSMSQSMLYNYYEPPSIGFDILNLFSTKSIIGSCRTPHMSNALKNTLCMESR